MASNSVDRIQGLSGSLALKAPVRTASTGALTLSGLQTVSGVVLASGDRVLVRHQADPINNGIYNADTGPWLRAKDLNGPNDAVQGTWVQVTAGTYAAQVYSLETPGTILPGSTPLVFEVLPSFAGGVIDPALVAVRRQTFTDPVGGVTNIALDTPYTGEKEDLFVIRGGITQTADKYSLPTTTTLALVLPMTVGETIDILSFNVIVGVEGPAGATGANGKTVLNGANDPVTEGTEGDFYINTTSLTIFGPKAGGVWGAGTPLEGTDGNTLLNGTVDPTTEGVDGDFYVNTTTRTFFGPKTGGAWGAGTPITAGADGKTVLNGTVDPTTEGVDGDFYINTTSNAIFGPKTGGAWGAGTSLVGPTGAAGADGTGALLHYVATAISRNAVAFDLVHVTAAGTTQTLPPSPTQWDTIGFRVDNFADTVVARNGNTIEGLAEDLTLNVAYEIRWLQWTGTSWRLIK